MNHDISFENICNDKLDLENNEQILNLTQKILEKYKLTYSEIIFNFLMGKDLLKIFELNRKLYKFIKESYLSELSLTYILVYLENLLESAEEIYRRKSLLKVFLKDYFEDINKLIFFCNEIVGDVFNKKINVSQFSIKNKSKSLLINDFLVGLNKLKLYYSIYFGKVNNRDVLKFKSETDRDTILIFIYKISSNLTNNEIMYLCNLFSKDMEKLSKRDFNIIKNIIKRISNDKSKIIVKSNSLGKDDEVLIKQLPTFLNKIDSEIIFRDFQNSNKIINKEGIEVHNFVAEVNENIYNLKIRKIAGSLILYIFDQQKILYKDRIYFLEDLRRFVLIIKEKNRIKENFISFWED